MKIVAWIDSEDYWFLNSMNQKGEAVDFYAYMMVATEPDDTRPVRIMVIELINAHMAIGFAIPENLNFEGGQEIGFICHENPSKDVAFNYKLSDEVKNVKYSGDDIQKIEYTGFTLEKFYENKQVKFYLNNLIPPKPENQDQP